MKDEFSFIDSISPKELRQKSLVKGIGDDAAVFQSESEMDEVVCVDTMVEGIHFLRSTVTPYYVGRKALVANISDLAAMGAIPSFYLVSIAIPANWDEDEVKKIFAGMSSLASEYDVDLIGGDTVSTTGPLVLSVTVIGRVEKNRALLRSSAKPGDVLFLTGHVGVSAAGLKLLLEKGIDGAFSNEELSLVQAHQNPKPHIIQGRLLATCRFRIATNDISDGLASEAHELAKASNVQIVIDKDSLPFHDSMSLFSDEERLHMALFGGEDYVLIGTVGEEHIDDLRTSFQEKGVPLFTIGKVEAGRANVLLKKDDELIVLEKKGYNHFKK